jgi:hypothetical protein
MDKRYQVFVSSTYQDLRDEREEVMQALLELDCIPSGMELFPAANEDQWTLIKKVIDDCDYYLVIVGGRYGSIGPEGMSYTEMEYRYALEKGKPIIAFLHKDPGELAANRTEQDSDRREKLKAFRSFVEKKHVKYWTNPADLGSVVSRSLVQLMKSNPAIGWVRADRVPDEEASQEILRLRKQVDELNQKLQDLSTKAPEGTQDLAQGEDEFEINYSFDFIGDYLARKKWDALAIATWNEIFSSVSPIMIDEASEEILKITLNAFIRDHEIERLEVEEDLKDLELYGFNISESDFQTIKVQLRALGLITKSLKPRSVKDTATYWTLTPYGDNVMTKLRAIRKSDED